MARTRYVTARMTQFERPDWGPLQLAVGEDLMWPWMWMYELRTTAGVAYHAYKHHSTRRYLHLGPEAEALQYVGRELYEPIELVDALERALRPWWEYLDATPEDVVASWIAIERARRGVGRSAR
jgi:hypothetical protein